MVNFDDDDDGDYGIVECGMCGAKIYRCEASLSDRYVYLCNNCEEEED